MFGTLVISKKRRLVVGVVVLLLVDFIWVGSSELTEYIFKVSGFNKPFFSTYFKSSLFSVFLLGFAFRRSWRMQCILPNIPTPPPTHSNDPCTEDSEIDHGATMSESRYVPVKSNGHDKSSDSESESKPTRSVRFSKLAEMRELSERYGVEAMYSRLSFGATRDAEENPMMSSGRYSLKYLSAVALYFSFLWFCANYFYQMALSKTQAAVVNVLSSTSGLFTLILAAYFPSSSVDTFTASKFLAVLLMIAGITTISLEDMIGGGTVLPLGVLCALLSSFMYACYLVLLKWKLPDENGLELTQFFGMMGGFNLITLWPLFILLHIFRIEQLTLPTLDQWGFLLLNGLVGTLASEVLWLWGCFLTSSVMATLALSLTIPLSMLFDTWIKGVSYSWLFYVGTVPIAISFAFITLITHLENADPLMEACTALSRWWCRSRSHYKIVSQDVNEEQSLIVQDDEDTDCDDIIICPSPSSLNHPMA